MLRLLAFLSLLLFLLFLVAGIAAGVVFVACIEVAVTAKCAVCTGSHFYMYVYPVSYTHLTLPTIYSV